MATADAVVAAVGAVAAADAETTATSSDINTIILIMSTKDFLLSFES